MNGYTFPVPQKELDANEYATLTAMVAEYPESVYWRNRLADFNARMELQHDAAWLDIASTGAERDGEPTGISQDVII